MNYPKSNVVYRMMVLFCLVMSLGVILGGCGKVQGHLGINTDNSADLEYKATLTSNERRRIGEPMLYTIKSQAVREGFSITDKMANHVYTIIARKHLKKVQDYLTQDLIQDNIIKMEPAGSPQSFGVVVKRNLFATGYIFNGSVNLTEPMLKMRSKFLTDPLISGTEWRFMVTFPFKPNNTNATEISNEGKTLSWLLKPGQTNSVRIVVTKMNENNIAIVTVMGVVFAYFLWVMILRIRKAFAMRRNAKARVTGDRQ